MKWVAGSVVAHVGVVSLRGLLGLDDLASGVVVDLLRCGLLGGKSLLLESLLLKSFLLLPFQFKSLLFNFVLLSFLLLDEFLLLNSLVFQLAPLLSLLLGFKILLLRFHLLLLGVLLRQLGCFVLLSFHELLLLLLRHLVVVLGLLATLFLHGSLHHSPFLFRPLSRLVRLNLVLHRSIGRLRHVELDNVAFAPGTDWLEGAVGIHFQVKAHCRVAILRLPEGQGLALEPLGLLGEDPVEVLSSALDFDVEGDAVAHAKLKLGLVLHEHVDRVLDLEERVFH